MSRLTELLRQAKDTNPDLGAAIESEIRGLSDRRSFGLNFERHRPEAVELPNRPVRRGDKVRILPPRGTLTRGDQRLWTVTRIQRDGATRIAHLSETHSPDADPTTCVTDDLVVIADFQDSIYPGLSPTGSVARGDDKPAHSVINGENYHVLKALTYTHRGAIDLIYIDPPYNSGATDWKYNNDYVDPDDQYRHSKWLAFMERRLVLAKELLDPDDSVLIATIDEKEVHRLALLLEQVFPAATIQMVTSVISAKGVVRGGQFSRVEEHVFFVTNGAARLEPSESNMLPAYRVDEEDSDADSDEENTTEPVLEPIEWLGLRRREPSSKRGTRPNQFYPIFIREGDGVIDSIGGPVDDSVDRTTVAAPEGTITLWPTKPDGSEMLWGLTPDILRRNWQAGYVRVNWNAKKSTGTVYYLPTGTIAKIKSGDIVVTGRAADGAVQGHIAASASSLTPPKRVWHMKSHNAETGGTNLLSNLIPKRRFPYPKSLYAVEDALRFYVKSKPDATILDFFAGSGTTAHAVMRLNREDGGRRQCISVTNNEVAAEEHEALRSQGLRPGDPEWESWGICDYITKPRIHAAITGSTSTGTPAKGKYRFNETFPLAEGLEENAEFFTLTYESPLSVGHNRAFERISSMLWLRAGARGPRIEAVPDVGFAVTDAYGVLVDLDQATAFCSKLSAEATTAYIVTNDERRYQAVARTLPVGVEPVRLYESYLTNFRFVNGE